MILNLLLVIAALLILAYSSDRFVVGAARISELLHVSPLIVGVVVIGFGTGLPELMTATVASVNHNPALGISSVIGSTIVNNTLVLGTLGAISAPRISSSVLKKEGLFQLIAIAIFGIVVVYLHNRISYLALVIVLVVSVYLTIMGARGGEGSKTLEQEAQNVEQACQWRMVKASVITMFGLLAILVSAELLVRSASAIATSLGMSNAVIGATLVALGTSLPEWVTAIAAARRGHSELVIGNIFGANLFNATGVAGIAGLIAPGVLLIPRLEYQAAIMIGVTLVARLFLSSSRRLTKREGWLLILVYLAWLIFILFK